MENIQNYISTLHQTIDQLPQELISEVIAILQRTRISGHQVFIMGNGGSASTATHFVCDLAKNTRNPQLPHYRAMPVVTRRMYLMPFKKPSVIT